MASNVNAEIIAIGTEILLGEITDTNSVHIARALRDIGVNVYFMTSVGDNEGRIADAIRIALNRSNVVITCGGLGPTIDDMTRQSVAAATDRGLTFHQSLLDMIAARFASFRAPMSENNYRQAYLPDNAIPIENPVGTAPSFIVEHGNGVVISLPGVPREMKYLLAERVIPFLKERFSLGTDIIKARVLRTAGLGESLLDDRLGKDLLEAPNPTVGLAAHAGQVDIRITAKAESVEIANEMIDLVDRQIRERVGRYIFGTDEARIEQAVLEALKGLGYKLVILEAGIGDPVSSLLREVDADRQVVIKESVEADPQALSHTLSLPSALPIRELAERAVEALIVSSGANAGIAIVSYPNMGEIHADADAGTAIAVRVGEQARSRVYGFGGQSETAPRWTTTWSLSMLWQMLNEIQKA
ncbi:MAG: competence/damage-inducible protein A [Anaerolineae bacterium]|nr:competence/damage-inducible protein A [Anaerolineae bacterium]